MHNQLRNFQVVVGFDTMQYNRVLPDQSAPTNDSFHQTAWWSGISLVPYKITAILGAANV